MAIATTLHEGYGLSDIVDEISENVSGFDEEEFGLEEDDFSSRLDESDEIRAIITGDADAESSYNKGFVDGYEAALAATGQSAGASSFFGELVKPKTVKDRTEAFIGKLANGSSIEASPHKLPPVYVEDQELIDNAVEQESFGEATIAEAGIVEIQDSFGTSAIYGLVSRMPRKRSSDAAEKALKNGAYLAQHADAEKSGGFVEDEKAQPYLLSSGHVIEPVYGELAAIPCPSCAQMSHSAAYSGHGDDCVVCEGFGAVLVPKEEVGGFLGMREAMVGEALVEGDNPKTFKFMAPESSLG
jgi:hypothetical protein